MGCTGKRTMPKRHRPLSNTDNGRCWTGGLPSQVDNVRSDADNEPNSKRTGIDVGLRPSLSVRISIVSIWGATGHTNTMCPPRRRASEPNI
eukprot:8505176-Pyramimonas_sp.AAC.5